MGASRWRTCPPPDTGRGRGPQDTSYRAAMTKEIVGGAGVSVANGVPPVAGLPSGLLHKKEDDLKSYRLFSHPLFVSCGNRKTAFVGALPPEPPRLPTYRHRPSGSVPVSAVHAEACDRFALRPFSTRGRGCWVVAPNLLIISILRQ